MTRGKSDCPRYRVIRKRSRMAAFLCLGVLLAAPLTAGAAAPIVSGGAEQAPPTAIPVPEVATQAAETQSLLAALTHSLAPDAELERIMDQAPALDEDITADREALDALLQQHPALGTLASQQQVWTERRLRTTRWLGLLTAWVTRMDAALDQLKSLQATWRQTEEAATVSRAPATILQLIGAVRAGIVQTHASLESHRQLALTLQGQVAQDVAQCETALQYLQQAQHEAMGGMLAREYLPVWKSALWDLRVGALTATVRDTMARRWQGFRQYLGTSLRDVRLPAGVLGLWLLLWMARRRSQAAGARSAEMQAAEQVFAYPLAALCVLLLVYLSAPHVAAAAPPGLRQLFIALGLVPAIRIIRSRIPAWAAHRLYLGAAVFALDGVRQAFVGAPGAEQALLILELLAAIGVLWWSFPAGALGAAHAADCPGKRSPRPWAAALLCVLGGALAGAALGYLRAARLIAAAVLGSGALALIFYAATGVILGLVALAFEGGLLTRLRMVQRHRALLLQRARRAIAWFAVGIWTLRSLDYIGLSQPVYAVVAQVLTATVERGAIKLSVADVLLFAATLYATFAFSKFIRFVLEEEVYPRTPVSRGVSYAFSTLLHYVIILLGFLTAVGVLGVDLTKVTIIAGALGVGIGLGLQGVVNNLVSGLILLFEQSIHVGDAVEVDGVAGQMSRIGIRASIVRTWQGAEVVVPNSLLVAQKLTNWTLSDRRRRIDLPVNVNYGTPPEQVLPLLTAVAAAHPRILAHPAPEAIFTGFGENAVTYELRAWTDHDSVWLQTRNELASTIYHDVRGAGMAFPFPQREIRVLGNGPAGPAASSSGGHREPPGAVHGGG